MKYQKKNVFEDIVLYRFHLLNTQPFLTSIMLLVFKKNQLCKSNVNRRKI